METGTSRSKLRLLKRDHSGMTAIELIVVLLIIAVLVMLLLPALQSRGSHGTTLPCRNNLQQLALGLLYYHETYGSFPPAYITDANGKPMHSWRVLILPFVEQRPLYEKYRFDEPWDGPNNRKLHSEKVVSFLCPSYRSEEFDQNWTNYVAVIGPQTAWPGAKPLKLEEITDDQEQTILLVEMKDSGIHWMEPRDLNFDDMSFQVNDPAGNAIGSWHVSTTGSLFWKKCKTFVNVAYLDGTPRKSLREDMSPETLKALLTIHGGENIDPTELER